jgi:hypothetical protein
MQRLVIIVLVFTVAVACGPKVTTTSTTASGSKHSEDLSAWRPKETATDTVKKVSEVPATNTKNQSKTVTPKLAINGQLDTILDSISEYNLVNGYVDGFTIQVYSGIKRDEALNAKKELSISLPDFDAEVQYVQPNFRVRSGKYYDRLEAQKDYLAIKKYFPDAIVIPDRIPIN